MSRIVLGGCSCCGGYAYAGRAHYRAEVQEEINNYWDDVAEDNKEWLASFPPDQAS